jgi:hypothetical protein
MFANEVRRQHRDVIWRTKKERYPTSDRWRTGLPIFLVGGGAASAVHRQETRAIGPWLRRHHCGGAVLKDLPIPQELDRACAPDGVHRLAVAFGLSRPENEIPRTVLPKDIEDDAPPRREDVSARYVSKEMC